MTAAELTVHSVLYRLFTAFASAVPQPQEEDATWQPAFKLSYDLGCLVLRSSQTLPPVRHDRVAIGSHMMRLTMQHQELVAAPTPVAGQGTILHRCQRQSAHDLPVAMHSQCMSQCGTVPV